MFSTREWKKKLRNAMNFLQLDGVFSETYRSAYGMEVYITTDNKPSDFEKNAKDLAYRMGVDNLTVKVHNKKRAVMVRFMVDAPQYPDMVPGSRNLNIPVGLSDDISMSRYEEVTIPGRKTTEKVYEHDVLMHDFEKNPHLLVAGTTGSGKSRFLHGVLKYILDLTTPYEIIPIDFKGTELGMYNAYMSNHYSQGTTIDNVTKASRVISELVKVMNIRYKELFRNNYRDIDDYNARTGKKLRRIFLVIDEFADMMLTPSKETKAALERNLVLLAQKSRAAGIHMIIATQKPTADVVPSHIKANIEGRVALRVASGSDSRVIIDADGAQELSPGELVYKLGGLAYGRAFNVTLENWDIPEAPVTYEEIQDTEPYGSTEDRSGGLTEEDAGAYARTVCDKVGLNYYQMTDSVLCEYKEICLFDLLAEIAIKFNVTTDSIQFYVRAALELMEYQNKISNRKHPGSDSVYINEAYLKGWVITNKMYKEPRLVNGKMVDPDDHSNIHNAPFNETICSTKVATHSLWDYDTEIEIADMLRYSTLDQRTNMLLRAIESAKGE